MDVKYFIFIKYGIDLSLFFKSTKKLKWERADSTSSIRPRPIAFIYSTISDLSFYHVLLFTAYGFGMSFHSAVKGLRFQESSAA